MASQTQYILTIHSHEKDLSNENVFNCLLNAPPLSYHHYQYTNSLPGCHALFQLRQQKFAVKLMNALDVAEYLGHNIVRKIAKRFVLANYLLAKDLPATPHRKIYWKISVIMQLT